MQCVLINTNSASFQTLLPVLFHTDSLFYIAPSYWHRHKDNMNVVFASCSVSSFKGGSMSWANVWTNHLLTARQVAQHCTAPTSLPSTLPSPVWQVWALAMSVPTPMLKRSSPSALCSLAVCLTPGYILPLASGQNSASVWHAGLRKSEGSGLDGLASFQDAACCNLYVRVKWLFLLRWKLLVQQARR